MPDQEPNEHEIEGPGWDRVSAALSSLTPDLCNARATPMSRGGAGKS